MNWHKQTLDIPTRGKGLYPFTKAVNEQIHRWGIQEGMCYLFTPHTSASLVVNESYDPTAREDMQVFLEKLVPEGEPWYRHRLEGPDDATSHLRAMLTHTSLTIPVERGELFLGTWQGVYLFEHRARASHRKVLLRCLQVV